MMIMYVCLCYDLCNTVFAWLDTVVLLTRIENHQHTQLKMSIKMIL